MCPDLLSVMVRDISSVGTIARYLEGEISTFGENIDEMLEDFLDVSKYLPTNS